MAESSADQSLPPERVLQRFNGRLYDAIQSPESLAEFMYTEEFIGPDVIDNLSSFSFNERKTKLLAAFRTSLRASSQKMQVMTKIYRSLESSGEPLLKDLASQMRALCPGQSSSFPTEGNVSTQASGISSAPRPNAIIKTESEAKDVVLGVQDLELIIEEIHELSDVERLGLNLGLYMPAIERIQDQYKSPGQQERRIILYWLQRKDIVPNKQACLPTWEALADAVAKQSTALSHKIRAKYCTPSP